MKTKCRLKLSKKPIYISENIIFLGESPKSNDFEERQSIGLHEKDGKWKADMVLEDSAIVYKNQQGIFIITGCSHSGICNIIEYAKKVCKEDKVIGVLGGFHLFKKDARLQKTIEYLTKQSVKNIYPCHCVSYIVKAEIQKFINTIEVGVGMELELN